MRFAQGFHRPFGSANRLGERRFRDDHRELFAAVTHDQIAIAHRGGQNIARMTQEPIARVVAVVLIDPLEVIEIDKQQRQRLVIQHATFEP